MLTKIARQCRLHIIEIQSSVPLNMEKEVTNSLIEYLFNLSKILQNATVEDKLSFKNSRQVVQEFVDSVVSTVIYIIKHEQSHEFRVVSSIDDSHRIESLIIVIKEKGIFTSNEELQISNFNNRDNKSSFEIIKTLINQGLSPYFENLTRDQQENRVLVTKKKFNELTISLQQILQRIEIPNLQLTCHERIKQAIKQHEKHMDGGSAVEDVVRLVGETDVNFLNQLENIVNKWVKEIQNITKLTNENIQGTTLEEINFWSSIELALSNIDQQLTSLEVLATLEILKVNKRFYITMSLINDTGLKESLGVSRKYNLLLRDLPIGEILSINNIAVVNDSIVLIFNHVIKKLRLTDYPIDRSIELVESIIGDIDLKLTALVGKQDLINVSYSQFQQDTAAIYSIFVVLDKQVKEYINLARELLRKRNEKFIIIKVNNKLNNLKLRINYIDEFRSNHQEFKHGVSVNESNLSSALDQAYEIYTEVNVVVISSDKLAELQANYNLKISRVENTIISKLDGLIAETSTLAEILVVYRKYKFLLNKSNIKLKSINQNFQNKLFELSIDSLNNLKHHLSTQEHQRQMFKYKDLPSLSSKLIWNKQIEMKSSLLKGNLQYILGDNWKQYSYGQKIYNELDVIEKQLNNTQVYETWLEKIQGLDIENSLNSQLFVINKNYDTYKLYINFNQDLIELFKNIRNLSYLNFDLPHFLLIKSRAIRNIYPYIVNLNETLKLFYGGLATFSELREFRVLMVGAYQAVLASFKLALTIQWKHIAENELVIGELNGSVNDFNIKLTSLNSYKLQLRSLLLDLTSCGLDSAHGLMVGIQAVVDKIILENFINVPVLVARLNQQIFELLVNKLKLKLAEINQNINQYLTATEHEIIIKDLNILVKPSLETTKILWIKQIQALVNTVKQKQIVYEYGATGSVYVVDEKVLKIINDLVETTYSLINGNYLECQKYLYNWYKFQYLWDLQIANIDKYLNQDIGSWLQLLLELRNFRNTFDTVKTNVQVNNVTFNYETIQLRINSKFDILQTQLFDRFGELVRDKFIELSGQLTGMKTYLVSNSLNSSIKNDLQLINKSFEYKLVVDRLHGEFTSYEKCQNLLMKNRYVFDDNWVYFEQLENELGAIEKLLNEQLLDINANKQTIIKKIEHQCLKINTTFLNVKHEWDDQRQKLTGEVQAVSNPLELLYQYKSKLGDLIEEIEEITRAIELADIKGLDASALDVSLASQCRFIIEELNDLIAVWDSINLLNEKLATIKAQLWVETSVRAIRKQLEQLLLESKSLPTKIRQYLLFENLQNFIKRILTSLKFLIELKNDSIKQRHWNEILSKDVKVELLSLEDVFTVTSSPRIKAIISKANGEKLIEDALAKIAANWANLSFELFQYQNKCRLVRNWNEIFKACNEDIEALSSMRNSPYYEVFDSECLAWSNKLNSIYLILDIWIDVQRQWIYLDGIFNNSDIQKLLQVENSRFQNITFDYFKLLQLIFRSIFVANVLVVPELHSELEKILEVLSRIRKSLSEYLENQRQLFPRFYFIGNEDLLNLIGNNDSPNYIGKFLNKIYPSIGSIEYEQASSAITEVHSKDGEAIRLINPIKLQGLTLIEWLKQLELELKQTLLYHVKQGISIWENAPETFTELVKLPLQSIVVSLQVYYTSQVELSINVGSYEALHNWYGNILEKVNSLILQDLDFIVRQKLEILLIELIYQHNTVEELRLDKVASVQNLKWKVKPKYYLNHSDDHAVAVTVKLMDNKHLYGFEYQGLTKNLVKNKIIENSFVNYNECLYFKKGGCSFGPAGTGKTESVKEFGKLLGRPVIIFCCDETFDFTSISRIFVGICQIGAWVCFDEFNRLNANMLSSVSLQIEKIELGLANELKTIELLDKSLELNHNTSVFVTMNPNYSGRSNLPENLKKLFKNYSISKTDENTIIEIILYSKGFKLAKQLSVQIVRLFSKLNSKLSLQIHYDFGLRALKNTMNYCGRLMRDRSSLDEASIIYQGIYNSVSPKLVEGDLTTFKQLLNGIFDEQPITGNQQLAGVLATMGVTNGSVVSKIVQLNELINNNHGIIMLGDTGSGKSYIRNLLLKALQNLDGKDSLVYSVNPKVSKELLYGSLDLTTREFKDGVFTSILRKLVNNLRGELNKRVWIVFDGDVDPEWIENLNSLLDDNKIFTLPNGEHLELPLNVKLMFETDDLSHSTPATVSRCGMIYVEQELIGVEELLQTTGDSSTVEVVKTFMPKIVQLLEKSKELSHIFKFLVSSKVSTFFSFVDYYKSQLANATIYNQSMTDKYLNLVVKVSIFWALGGDCDLKDQEFFNLYMNEIFHENNDYINTTIGLPEIELSPWRHGDKQPGSLIIPTPDTIKLTHIIDVFVQQQKLLILCGPPGSGKTMVILDYFRNSLSHELISLNFSAASTVNELLLTLNQYCYYKPENNGILLLPKAHNKRLVVFIDEINLPNIDHYGSQPLIMFLRQIILFKGFYSKDNVFVQLQDIQFIAACNPSTDIGRKDLSLRFLRLAGVVFVDYPNKDSLNIIYNQLLDDILESQGIIKPYRHEIIDLVLKIYYKLKHKVEVLTPRDLTRLVNCLKVGLLGNDNMKLDDFLRLLNYECIRLFSDRYTGEVKQWIIQSISQEIRSGFNLEFDASVIFSRWLSSTYLPVDPQEFNAFVQQRFKIFNTEVLDTNLIIYPELLNHIARIDRVLSIPQGHLILIGSSSLGKTVLCKFVSWINGLKIVQLSVNKNYKLENFDHQLKDILKSCGACGEKICFIIDESSILESSFIERMNTLLANSEIPSLFSETEFKDLMNLCLENSQKQGLLLDSEQELYKWFCQQITNNLHVIFTINNHHSDILKSPALINRCIINYIEDWDQRELAEVGQLLIERLAIDSKPELVKIMIQIHTGSQDNPAMASAYKYVQLYEKFIEIYRGKQQQLDDHQRHINIGLDKLKDTVIQVKNLKDDLSVKKKQLNLKDIESKNMLDEMLVDQNQAERKQEASIEVQESLKVQEQEIQERKVQVSQDLDQMIPIINNAAQNVKNIKKQNLSELRSMNNPPEQVKMTLEVVCYLIGYKGFKNWKEIQLITRKDDFIVNILNFANNISQARRDYLDQEYLSKDNFNIASVSRASKACGPLLEWIEAQIKYSRVKDQVDPLRQQVHRLESIASENKIKLRAIKEMLGELNLKIEEYKLSYSQCIRDIENIKTEMQTVENKIARSMELIENLQQERDRWLKISFEKQQQELAGNCVLSSAMLAYNGYFDEQSRGKNIAAWKNLLASYDLAYDDGMVISEYLNTSKEVIQWKDYGLVNDDIYIENMTMLKYNQSYPYIIDPSRSIVDVLAAQYPKLTITSFLDLGFLKHIENGLRFGGTVLIEDSEHLDPLVNNLLKRQLTTTSGRLLIQLGQQEIDYSEGFKLFLFSRNPSIAGLGSHLLARTNIVNFTTTKNNLQAKIINLSLLKNYPLIEVKRQELIKLNGEYKTHLRGLEDDLLTNLSDSTGNILNNDKLVASLENIKKESMEIEVKMQETTSVINEAGIYSSKFKQFAVNASNVYSVLCEFVQINRFYQFSLQYYMAIIDEVLSGDFQETDSETLSDLLITKLYKEVVKRSSVSLKQDDRVKLYLSLTLVYLSCNHEEVYSQAKEIFTLDKDQVPASEESSKQITNAMQLFYANPSNYHQAFTGVLNSLLNTSVAPGSLDDVFLSYTNGSVPIILVSQAGFDPTFKIELLSKLHGVGLAIVSMGSPESIEIANNELKKCNQQGSWLLIQNAQLAPEWLEYINKQLAGLVSSNNFRLILTCQFDSSIANTLINTSYVLTFETQPGIKNALNETFTHLAVDRPPLERTHVTFLLSWLNSIVQELLRFTPIGFTKCYDFNNTDFEFCLNIVNRIINNVSGDRINISPDSIPWDELRYIIGTIGYASKIDDALDYSKVQALVGRLFNNRAFESDFNLLPEPQKLFPPESRKVQEYNKWIENLPIIQPPAWLGLEDNAESLVGEVKGKEIIAEVMNMTDSFSI